MLYIWILFKPCSLFLCVTHEQKLYQGWRTLAQRVSSLWYTWQKSPSEFCPILGVGPSMAIWLSLSRVQRHVSFLSTYPQGYSSVYPLPLPSWGYLASSPQRASTFTRKEEPCLQRASFFLFLPWKSLRQRNGKSPSTGIKSWWRGFEKCGEDKMEVNWIKFKVVLDIF